MRNLFTLILAVALLAVACEPVVQTPEEQTFEVTSDSVVNIAAEGGTFVIAYTLNGGDHAAVKAEADNNEMITAINIAQPGYIVVSVAANTQHFERESSVRVSYEGEAYIITVKQEKATGSSEGYEVFNINANQLIGNYYGERLVNGLGHYWIIISDGGIVDGALANNAEFFRLDLLGPIAPEEGDVRIPDGTYNFELESSFNPYTMPNIGNTDYVYTDSEGEAWSVIFTEAQLIVEGNSFRLFARTEDKEFHVTFNGDYNITKNTVSEYISTLRGDYEIDLSNCTGSLMCFGDYWECGYCNWQIEFVHNNGLKYGTYLVLDFITDAKLNGASGVAGTYRSSGFCTDDPSKPAFDTYTFVPGIRISEDGVFMMGSLLQVYKDGKGVDQAPIFGGEFTITENSNGTYTIVIDATDDVEPANKITLNWTGRLN